MKIATGRLEVLVLATVGGLALCSCNAYTDKYWQDIRIRCESQDEVIQEYAERNTNLPEAESSALADGRVYVGMRRELVELSCGDTLDKLNDGLWRIQTRAIAAYPLDAREAYLYFPWNSDKVAAIVVRGWYWVPL